MGEFVRIDTEGGVATVRIDRPPANALARAVSAELSEAAGTVTRDEAVRAVVVMGCPPASEGAVLRLQRWLLCTRVRA